MKRLKMLFFLAFLIPLFCSAQNIILPNINIPGSSSVGAISGAVLGENLIGPRQVIFLQDQMILQKNEIGKKSSGRSVAALNIDKLPTLYSGRIFSPGILEPFVFVNKTPEELALIKVVVFPLRLEIPYTLYLDLEVKTSSKPVSANQSDDAGMYNAKIIINLIKI